MRVVYCSVSIRFFHPLLGQQRSDQPLQTQTCQTRPKKSWSIFATTPAVCRTAGWWQVAPHAHLIVKGSSIGHVDVICRWLLDLPLDWRFNNRKIIKFVRCLVFWNLIYTIILVKSGGNWTVRSSHSTCVGEDAGTKMHSGMVQHKLWIS